MSCWYACYISNISHKKVVEFTKFQTRSNIEETQVKQNGGFVITSDDEPAFSLCEKLQELRTKIAQLKLLYPAVQSDQT